VAQDNGASFKLLEHIDDERLKVNLSVPLFLEYEDAAKRLVKKGGLISSGVDDILNYITSISTLSKIYYLWRPFLKDPKDDMVLELAVASNSKSIVTFNKPDFAGVEQFGIELVSPKELLVRMGECR